MKRILLALAFIGVFGATTATAQTRVSVSVGFGIPAPYVVYRPRPYRYYYETYPIVVVQRPFYRRAPLVIVRRQPIVVVRRHGWRRHHRHW